ncbi:MAG: hypothetical protein OEQ18_05280, partial [Gammaproteobacteria bacterium]|nr:hypothetical protein [Gammaproteobacteria bacterium]
MFIVGHKNILARQNPLLPEDAIFSRILQPLTIFETRLNLGPAADHRIDESVLHGLVAAHEE